MGKLMEKLIAGSADKTHSSARLPWWGKFYLFHKFYKDFMKGKYYNDFFHGSRVNWLEGQKKPLRTDVLNYLLSLSCEDTHYLEIGVRNPNDNFIHIIADKKYSVDPGIEFKENPVDYKMTSDEFFAALAKKEILAEVKFDVIFIDGLHLAEQVNRDIINALQNIKKDGFVVLHDCNPPTQWHARENYYYRLQPARGSWNGTTWKAFLKWRFDSSVYSCCIASDFGIGILSKTQPIGESIPTSNPFFEFSTLENNREKHLNLIDFEALKSRLSATR